MPESAAAKLYSENRAVGKTGKVFDTLTALSSRNNLKKIEALHERCMDSGRLVEIGMAFGGSALTFAEIHSVQSESSPSSHVAIDPFPSTVWDGVGSLRLEGGRAFRLRRSDRATILNCFGQPAARGSRGSD